MKNKKSSIGKLAAMTIALVAVAKNIKHVASRRDFAGKLKRQTYAIGTKGKTSSLPLIPHQTTSPTAAALPPYAQLTSPILAEALARHVANDILMLLYQLQDGKT